MYIPKVGILIEHHVLDLSISNSRREVNHLLLTPRGGDFDNFFRKCQNLYPMPGLLPPHPLWLDNDRCIIISGKLSSVNYCTSLCCE